MDEERETRDSKLATPLHTIRLRHPWQCEVSGDLLVWSRKFNWPAEPDESERVQLVAEGLPASARLSVNGTPTTPATSATADITDVLSVHNRIVITIAGAEDDPPERFPYEVRLEIVGAC